MKETGKSVNTYEKAGNGGKNRYTEGIQPPAVTTDGEEKTSEMLLQWHPAFCAATELEFMKNREQLKFQREYTLGKKPLQIDLLVIEKRDEVEIENEIGRIFRRYNIMEYKSPEDALTIDDFFKTLGYACIYKGLGKTVNQIPIDQLTISLVREGRPAEMLRSLAGYGFAVEKKFNGIYYIHGLPVPAQVIVTGELDSAAHNSLKILSKKAKETDIRGFIEEAQHYTRQGDRENVDAVLQVSAAANYELFEEMKRRDWKMCEAMRRLMKEEFDGFQAEVDAANLRTREAEEKTKEAEKKTKEAEKRTKDLAVTLAGMGMSAEKIAETAKVGIETVQQWLAGNV